MGYDVVRYPDPTGSIGPHLLALLERTRVDCVLDVGAHWGAYGMLLRKAGYRGDIVSFEPVSSSASELDRSSLDAGVGCWLAAWLCEFRRLDRS
jgi:hypothetical protein